MNPNKRERVKPSEKYQVMVEQGLPAAISRGVASYYADLHEATGAQVCVGTSCLLASEQADCENADCRGVYCLGYCDRSPAWLDAEGRLQHGAGGLDIRCHAGCPVVTRRLGNGGASSLRRARELGAYETLATALAGEPAAVLAAMERSGERGRGGAAFPTFLKWQSCAGTAAESRYVIANGDEGDPGSFIDRVLMEKDPHGILEGLMLCGFAVGAREGIVFIRSEYPRAIAVMEEAIRELRKAELIGRDILSSGFDFEISVAAGMGSYVCGEETALINALEGRPGPGSAVFVSSVVARIGVANHEAIAAAKGGLEALVRSAAATYATRGLRFNVVAPGLTETPLTAGMLKHDAMREAAARQYPLGGVQSASDVASAITWLLSPDSSRITGQILPVDGGFTAVRPLVK